MKHVVIANLENCIGHDTLQEMQGTFTLEEMVIFAMSKKASDFKNLSK